MPRTSKPLDSRIAKTCEAYWAAEKPNMTKIACEYGLPHETLRDCVKKGSQPKTAIKPVNYTLERY